MVDDYCDSYSPSFDAELSRQAEDLVIKRRFVLFGCTAFVISVNSLKAGPQTLLYLIPLFVLIFLPRAIRACTSKNYPFNLYFDFMIGMHALMSALIAVQVLNKGMSLSNGPIQALLIVSCWFVYNSKLLYIVARNFAFAGIMVAVVGLSHSTHFHDALLQGIGGFIGGSLLAYFNLKNHKYKFYALSLKERWNDHLQGQLQMAEEVNQQHVEDLDRQRQVISSQFDRLSKVELLELMASSVQMLAHDVRKPFSLVRMGVQMLKREKDPEKHSALIDRLDRAFTMSSRHVDGMVQDLLAVGNGQSLKTEEVSLITMFIESIILATEGQDRQIDIQYDCQHTHCVKVDVKKVQRIFNNLVGNAFEAAKDVSLIKLVTSMEGASIRIGIFNDKSFRQFIKNQHY